jgi:hypothetical protein
VGPALARVIVPLLAIAGWLVAAATAVAESPAPSQAAIGDPRSSGAGPGLVGDPLFAIGIVAVIAIASLGATLLYVRASGGRRDV